jgi:hypothetical protein
MRTADHGGGHPAASMQSTAPTAEDPDPLKPCVAIQPRWGRGGGMEDMGGGSDTLGFLF